jgi:subtilase family serine protease
MSNEMLSIRRAVQKGKDYHMRSDMLPKIGIFMFLIILLASCNSSALSQTKALPTKTPTNMPTVTPTATIIPASPGNYGYQELRRAYHMEELLQEGITGKGQTVIVTVSYGDPHLQEDFDAYNQYYGLPSLKLQIIAPLGPSPLPTNDPFDRREHTGWSVETALDVEMIHAIAPDARIIVLTSPVDSTEGVSGLPEFRQLIQYAIDNHLGSIISNSWGFSEASLQNSDGQSEVQRWGPLLQEAAMHQGITFFFASGDRGATDYTDQFYANLSPVATIDFPADEPWVTAVGGTSLTFSNGQPMEEAWNGSGGGISAWFDEPSFQKPLPPSIQSQLHGKRGIPDVAMVAASDTGVKIYANGQWMNHIGGTSVGTPIWAGMMSLVNQKAGKPLGFLNPLLYEIGSNQSAFQDITVGNNTTSKNGITVTGYSAATGWDLVTGFGSPNAGKLVHELTAVSSS